MAGERTSPGIEVLTRIGYQMAGDLSREIFTYLAQAGGRTSHHQDAKAPSSHNPQKHSPLPWGEGGERSEPGEGLFPQVGLFASPSRRT